ncbi:MAG: DUF308 domain-containing protein [Alistipes sp.]|nr:DUF308 domain-containing protein [Alistipes sp.]MBO7262982.1 DUF308 domain-containing protein [Alistipes sp.]
MTNKDYEKTEYLIRRWWLSLLAGIVAVIIGFIILVNPVTSYYIFAIWLGVAIFVSGVFGLIQSTSSKNYFVRRGWLILANIADVVIGLILLFNAIISEVFMPTLLGFWLLYRGATMLIQGFDLRDYGIRDAGWVVFYAALIIALAVAILWLPMTFGIEAVILFIAIAVIAYGISTISLSYRLWEVHRHAKAIQSPE